MKTLLLFTASFFSIFLYSQKDVKLIGHLVDEDDYKIKNAKIYLYAANTLMDSVTTKKKGVFSFYLAKNNSYTVVMTAGNYAPKKMSVNTNIPAEEEVYENFEFIMEMIPMVEGVDYSELDFPVALIEYSSKKREMIFVSSYAKAMKIEQKRITQEVKIAQKK